MTTTLQQALIKAGLVSKEKAKKVEVQKKQELRQVQRPHVRQGNAEAAPKKSVGFIEGKHHHHLRTDCEACQKSSPDVEYYEHKNRILENKKWLCVRCADYYSISDEFRQTVQSQHAKSRRFRREYGATKVFK